MPTRPRNPCPRSGCSNYAPCPEHSRPAWRTTTEGFHKRYGNQWEKIRKRKLRQNPLCEVCGAPATNVDHIRAKAFGGTDDPSNLRSLCLRHKMKKDLEDSRRGTERKRR